MVKAIIFSNEDGEWFIDWIDPSVPMSGPYQSLEEAVEDYNGVYPDLPKSYVVSPYSETGEWM